jgi:hypothetical protein
MFLRLTLYQYITYFYIREYIGKKEQHQRKIIIIIINVKLMVIIGHLHLFNINNKQH